MSTTYRIFGAHPADQDMRRVNAELAAMYAHAGPQGTADGKHRVRLVRRALHRLSR